jgi:hypothetical protein
MGWANRRHRDNGINRFDGCGRTDRQYGRDGCRRPYGFYRIHGRDGCRRPYGFNRFNRCYWL